MECHPIFRSCNIRNTSLAKVAEHACDFYFTADIDNFVTPATLRELVALELPIVAPYLRHVDQNKLYSNYHADIDANGYFRSTPRYGLIWSREIAGLIEVPVVHCTYLIRADVVPQLGYDDDSGRHEYVVFSHRARECGIPQYFDNRRIYGLLTLDDRQSRLDRAAKNDHPTYRARRSGFIHVIGKPVDRCRGFSNEADARLASFLWRAYGASVDFSVSDLLLYRAR